MSGSSALDSFVDKWRARWPEWNVASGFVAPAQRDVAVAWFALLQEFEDAMNIAGDPLPADAKLAWWGEELRDWSRQRSRHPLGRTLEPRQAPWADLADALPTLIQARASNADARVALAQLQPYAKAVDAVELALFAATNGQPATTTSTRLQAIAAQTLAARWMETAAVIPAAQWQALLQAWPAPRPGSRERRLWSAFARRRAQNFARDNQAVALASPIRQLFTAWRAAAGA